MPQQERCPRGGRANFFCRSGHKIEQVGADLRKPKQKKGHCAKLIYFSASFPFVLRNKILKLPQGKRQFGRGAGRFEGTKLLFGGAPTPLFAPFLVAALSVGSIYLQPNQKLSSGIGFGSAAYQVKDDCFVPFATSLSFQYILELMGFSIILL